MATWRLPLELVTAITQLGLALHGRLAWRLLPVFTGMLFARGRRTAASWWRAASVGRDFRTYYYFLGSLGRKVELVAGLLLSRLVAVIAPGERLLFAIDDTPTKRYGPRVEGAGIHHNPTPGPADQKFLYGHIWVTVAWVVRHARWGAIGLPLRALLYVRRKQIGLLQMLYGVRFRTKLEMAAELVEWLVGWLKYTGKKLWIVVDGAYAKRPFLRRALAAGVVVVSRLRRDAALWSVPPLPDARQPRKRGPKPKYGKQAISLAKRAGQQRGWQTAEFELYGKKVARTFKTFEATYKPASGRIRVVIVRSDDGWLPFFCTDAAATVAEILEAVADRATIEQDFHDLKEVHGAGQQQLRHYWANLAAWHLNLWLYCLIEFWAWCLPQGQLCDRKDRPWDDADRRPSHADRRNALRRRCVEEEMREHSSRGGLAPRFRRLVGRLLKLVVWA